MTVPLQYTQASQEFERFIVAARDALDHATTHQAYYSVLAVFVVFRRRVSAQDGLNFADVLPACLRAMFVTDWDLGEPIRRFTTRAELTDEAQAFRREHSFTPPEAIGIVATVLRQHVDPVAFDRALTKLPPEAADYWRAPSI